MSDHLDGSKALLARLDEVSAELAASNSSDATLSESMTIAALAAIGHALIAIAETRPPTIRQTIGTPGGHPDTLERRTHGD